MDYPKLTLAPLERIQRMATKVVLRRGKYDSATEAMSVLHWLPVAYRNKFKIACLVFQSLFGTAPDLLCVRRDGRLTRASCDGTLLAIPTTKRKTFAERSFSVAGPEIWNELPRHLRGQSDFNQFKRDLKTFYFQKAYNRLM